VRPFVHIAEVAGSSVAKRQDKGVSRGAPAWQSYKHAATQRRSNPEFVSEAIMNLHFAWAFSTPSRLKTCKDLVNVY